MKQFLAQEKITNPAFEGSPLGGITTGKEFFQKLIPNLVGLAFVVGAIIFFFIMIIGAIQWISSGGDKTAIEGARGKIANALVGFVILLSLFALLKVIESFFGIDILTLDIGPLMIE
jgi:uncharacterized membrane protein